jgi:hypothetical protein
VQLPEPPRGREGKENSTGWKRGYCISSKITPSQNEITGFPETQGTRCHSIRVFPFWGGGFPSKNSHFSARTEGKGTHSGESGGFSFSEAPFPMVIPENFERNTLHFEEKKRKTEKINREVFFFASHVDSFPLSEKAQLLY